MFAPQPLRLRLEGRALVVLTGQHGQRALGEQILEAVPLLEAQEHVGPQQEDKLVVRVAPAQGGDGVRAVAAPPAPARDV